MKRLLGIIIVLIIILTGFIYFADIFCSKNKPISDANVLVIEGWLPSTLLEEICLTYNFGNYRDVIITGNNFTNNFHGSNLKSYSTKGPLFLGNGAILLKDEVKKSVLKQDNINTIKVYAKGTQCKGVNAHFTLFLNDKIIGQAFTGSSSREFKFELSKAPDSIAMFIVNFDNDIKIENEDRNLFIDSIVIGRIKLMRNDFYFARNDYPERYGFGFNSNAERTFHYFLSLKPASNLHFISASSLQRNFTKYSAQTCKKFLQTKYPGQNLKINVISTDLHSARSYFTYKKELTGQHIGIISLKPYKNLSPKRIQNFKSIGNILEEYFGIIISIL
jgi:hypothetical protein